MASGGRRNRSGPAADPKSGRSERRAVKLSALPATPYDGEVPAWPLPKRTIWNEWWEGSGRDRERHREVDDGATAEILEREHTMWEWAWRSSLGWAWSQPSESWRLHTIAMWVRTYVICEGSEATAADKGSLHRFADQIGMTKAGQIENGWAIAVDEVGARAADRARERDDDDGNEEPPKRARRLRAQPGA